MKGDSRLYRSQVLELKTKAAKARTSIMAHQQKKKEGESSNTLQSDGNKPTYSKEADEVILLMVKKFRYNLSAIVPLVNLNGNLSKFLTKTSRAIH